MWDEKEIEIWKEIRTTQGWELIEKEIDQRVRNSMEELVMCNPTDVIRIQERVKALNELKTMPEQVIRREVQEP